MLKVNINF